MGVTAYFMLGRTETSALLSGRGKICVRLQKGTAKCWHICRNALWHHVRSQSEIKFTSARHLVDCVCHNLIPSMPSNNEDWPDWPHFMTTHVNMSIQVACYKLYAIIHAGRDILQPRTTIGNIDYTILTLPHPCMSVWI